MASVRQIVHPMALLEVASVHRPPTIDPTASLLLGIVSRSRAP
jgi:hypothetical protein